MPESEETPSGRALEDRAEYHNVGPDRRFPCPTSTRRYAMTGHAPLPYDFMPAVPSFELRSDDVADGQMMWRNQVLDGFGMTGANISPSLSWSGFWPAAACHVRELHGQGLRWCGAAGRAPAAPLRVRGACARRGVAGRQQRDLSCHGRLQLAFRHHRACPAHPRVRLLIFNTLAAAGRVSRGCWPTGPAATAT